MTIDITTHLRRLVMAGLPLALAGCPAPPSTSAEPSSGTSRVAACQPRLVFEDSLASTALSAGIAFSADDPRFADLYQACLDGGDYCRRLCREILAVAPLGSPPGHQISGPHACELGCDSEGRPVARVRYSTFSTAAIGRRPEGFAGGVSAAPGTSLADFFTACATLEGASIAAFQILAAELAHHGAPASLVARAHTAARDEARHFKQTTRLAHQFGAGRVRCPRVDRRPPRALLEVALENASEGCVAETFSAAVALHQAVAAANPRVRLTMAAIAEDELGHAQLAWDVHAWMKDRLPGEADTLARARAGAAAQLLAGCAQPVAPALVLHAGMPDAAASQRLAAAALPLWV